MKKKVENQGNINKYFWGLYESKEYEKILGLLENYSKDDLLSREQLSLIKAYSLELGSDIDLKEIELLYKNIVENNPGSIQALIDLTYFYLNVLDDHKSAVKTYFKLKKLVRKYNKIVDEMDKDIIQDQIE